MRLYSRGARLAFLKRKSKKDIEALNWALGLKPGDLINDCSGANVVIREINMETNSFGRGYYDTSHGWYAYDVEFVDHKGGSCSLMHCGLEDPKSREEVEAGLLEWYQSEWMTDPTDTKESLTKNQKRIAHLKSGGHVCDERGVILPEWW